MPHVPETGRECAPSIGADAAERFRALFDALDEGLCTVEVLLDERMEPVDCRFLEVNPAFERHLGICGASGRLLSELAHEHKEGLVSICGEAALTRRRVRVVRCAGARPRWYEIETFPIGDPCRQVGLRCNDITERREVEHSLGEREEQLRLILESATEFAIVVTDEQQRVTGWNSGAERLLGYRESEIVGRTIDVLFTDENRASGQPQADVSAAAAHGPASKERWYQRKDGTRFWGSGVMFHLRDGGSASSGFLMILRDRTAEREVEENLRRSEERLRLAIETAELGTWEYFPAEQRFLLDERTRDLAGVPPGVEPTYEIFIQSVHEDDRARVHSLVQRVLTGEGGGHYRDEWRITRLIDGAERWIRAAGRVHFDAKGAATHVVGTLLDISDLMNARELLARRSEELERIVEERTSQLRDTVQQLETFSYSVVHDMRAPLRSVRSFAHLLNEEYGSRLDENARGYLQRLQASVARMDSLITDVLTYSQVNSSDATLAPVNVDQLAHEIVEQYPQFQESRESVVIQSPLPTVLGNRALLTQCFSNLLDNALKFIPPGRNPRVTVRAEPHGPRARIWVEDNGIGIPPEHRDRIFGLFQRLHRLDQYPGTGVGLAIVHKAVERMRGSVGVDSAPGRGSRFWIDLLASEPQREPQPAGQ